MDSDNTDQWEILSESSNNESFHITSPVSNKHNDDNHSVHSIQSLDSSQSSTTSSIINVNINPTASQQPSSLIPQIDENQQININNNNNTESLIPSYIDIQSELQRQRDLVNELKIELNVVTNERDQIRSERDELKERVNNNALEIAILRDRNLEIDRQNLTLRQMTQKYRGRKLRKMRSKNDVSITNKKGHRPSVPAKLRFRRQRTTHRSVYHQQRNW